MKPSNNDPVVADKFITVTKTGKVQTRATTGKYVGKDATIKSSKGKK